MTKWDKEADIVIVGLGGAGGCCAIEAADAGLKVIVLEADKVPGGNTRLSGGTLRVFLDAEGAFQYYRHVFDETVKDELIHRMVDVSMDMHDWFREKCDCDFRESSQKPFPPAPNTVWPWLPGADALAGRMQFVPKGGENRGKDHRMNGGYNLWTCMQDGLDKRADKIETLMETRGRELIQNAKGDVIGIKATTADGSEINIRAKKGVALTCGGFGRNNEMMINYLSMPIPSEGTKCQYGDGLTMTQRIGAKMWHMTGLSCTIAYDVPEHEEQIGANYYAANYLYIDQKGKRFLDEGGTDVHAMGFDFTQCVAKEMSYPRFPSWLIFDEHVRKAGGIIGHCPGIIQEDPTFPGWSDDNMAEIEKGWIKMGYSLKELGEKCGFPEGVLEAAVGRYNMAAISGYDPDFGRETLKMGPVTEAPFYAIQVYPSLLNTQGGPQHDEYGRVLDLDENPIGHLFAAGELGSIVNKFYPGGTNITEAVAMGRFIGGYVATLEDTEE